MRNDSRPLVVVNQPISVNDRVPRPTFVSPGPRPSVSGPFTPQSLITAVRLPVPRPVSSQNAGQTTQRQGHAVMLPRPNIMPTTSAAQFGPRVLCPSAGQPRPACVQDSRGPGVAAASDSGSGIPADVVKCGNFLENLIKLAKIQSEKSGTVIHNLVQQLVDGRTDPESFLQGLQAEMKGTQKPQVISFLQKTLPRLRHCLQLNKLKVKGVEPPPHHIIKVSSLVSKTQAHPVYRDAGTAAPVLRSLSAETGSHAPSSHSPQTVSRLSSSALSSQPLVVYRDAGTAAPVLRSVSAPTGSHVPSSQSPRTMSPHSSQPPLMVRGPAAPASVFLRPGSNETIFRFPSSQSPHTMSRLPSPQSAQLMSRISMPQPARTVSVLSPPPSPQIVSHLPSSQYGQTVSHLPSPQSPQSSLHSPQSPQTGPRFSASPSCTGTVSQSFVQSGHMVSRLPSPQCAQTMRSVPSSQFPQTMSRLPSPQISHVVPRFPSPQSAQMGPCVPRSVSTALVSAPQCAPTVPCLSTPQSVSPLTARPIVGQTGLIHASSGQCSGQTSPLIQASQSGQISRVAHLPTPAQSVAVNPGVPSQPVRPGHIQVTRVHEGIPGQAPVLGGQCAAKTMAPIHRGPIVVRPAMNGSSDVHSSPAYFPNRHPSMLRPGIPMPHRQPFTYSSTGAQTPRRPCVQTRPGIVAPNRHPITHSTPQAQAPADYAQERLSVSLPNGQFPYHRSQSVDAGPTPVSVKQPPELQRPSQEKPVVHLSPASGLLVSNFSPQTESSPGATQRIIEQPHATTQKMIVHSSTATHHIAAQPHAAPNHTFQIGPMSGKVFKTASQSASPAVVGSGATVKKDPKAPAVNLLAKYQTEVKTTATATTGSTQPGKRKFDTLRDGDDDINDVATMGGINISEETKNILRSGSELIGSKIRSCPDTSHLSVEHLKARVMALAKKKGLEAASPEAIQLIARATEQRLADLVQKLSITAEHRMETYKTDTRCEITSDVRAQLKFLEERDRAEKRQHDEAEREMLMRAVKSRSRPEDPDKQKLKQRAKEMQQLELEEARQREANLTALAAIGPRKKRILDVSSSTNAGNVDLSKTGAFGGSSGTQLVRQRPRRVAMKDMLFIMEQDQHLSKSSMFYQMLLK